MARLRLLQATCRRSAFFRQTNSPSCNRLYHSYEHDQPPPFNRIEDRILSAALSHVPTLGFTTAALTQGARDAGFLDVSTNLFPMGAFAIIKYHLVTQRLGLANHAPSNNEPHNDVSSNIRILALRRLHGNEHIIHRWQEALALLATPKHLPTSVRELALLSDELLFLAGSTTVDTTWYINRAALATIYASTELFMTTDKSKNFAETEDFLTRRLEEGEMFKGVAGSITAWAGIQAGSLLDGLRSKGVWV